MARMIRHEATGPIEVPPQDKSVWICACGLTQTPPYCDGAHKACRRDEEPGKLYIYDKDHKNVIDVRDDAE